MPVKELVQFLFSDEAKDIVVGVEVNRMEEAVAGLGIELQSYFASFSVRISDTRLSTHRPKNVRLPNAVVFNGDDSDSE